MLALSIGVIVINLVLAGAIIFQNKMEFGVFVIMAIMTIPSTVLAFLILLGR